MPRPRLLLPLVVLLAAGCAEPAAEGGEEFAGQAVAVTWQAPVEEGGRSHDVAWEVVNVTQQDGVTTFETTTHGIEGGDFRFTLRYRADRPLPVLLTHDETLAAPNSFRFTYREAVFWAGRDVAGVESVDPSSWVEVAAQDLERGELRLSFHLDFTGRCGDERVDCGEDPSRLRTVLDGRFPAR